MTAASDDIGARIGYEGQGLGGHGGAADGRRGGQAEGTRLRVAFDRRVRLEFHGATVTSDAGLRAFRQLDAALGLTGLATDLLRDNPTRKNGRLRLLAQVRQAVFGRLAGYETTVRAGGYD